MPTCPMHESSGCASTPIPSRPRSPEPDSPSHRDRLFAESLNMRKTVLGYVFGSETRKGALPDPVAVLDRNFRDTWNAGVAYVDLSRKTRGYSLGFSYDSSPVRNRDRTIDLPFDETYKLSAAYGWLGGKQLNFAIGGTLMYFGDGKVDQVAQGVRFKGEFDTNMALFLGGTVNYVF